VQNTQRGRLHVFLGAAPAAGKTYASLQEARRLADEGVEVVVGLVETHGRAALDEQLEGLVVITPRQVFYRGHHFDELDLPALLEQHPQTVLVDELAHSNSPGLAHAKRWQDVEQLLDAGVNVISNLNVQHLASLSDEVERITALPQSETVPDELVASAARIDLVRVSAADLRKRIGAGEIFEKDVATTALAGFFSAGHLEVLDELMMRWMSEHGRSEVLGSGSTGDAGALPASASDRGTAPPRSGPLVAVLSGAAEGARLLRRAAQLAKSTGSDLVGLRIREPSDPRDAEPAWLQGQRHLLTELGGRYAEVGGEDVAKAVLRFAQTEGAAHLVLGATRRSRLDELAHGSLVKDVVKANPALELHVVPPPRSTRERQRDEGADETSTAGARTRPAVPRRFPQWRRSELPLRRRVTAYVLAFAAPAAIAGALVPLRDSVGLPGTLMTLLLAVTLVAGVGGLGPAVVSTVFGVLLSDYYLTHPLHSFRLDRVNEIFALIAFAAVAVVVSVLVNVLTNAGVVGARRLAVAGGLARLAADCLVAAGSSVPQKTLDALRSTLDLDGVSVLSPAGPDWNVETVAGEHAPQRPEEASSFVEIGDGRVLALAGGRAVSEESDLIRTFVSEIRLEHERVQLERIRRLAGDGSDLASRPAPSARSGTAGD